MEHVALVSSEVLVAIRGELRDARVTPGTSFLLVSGFHPELGETMLVQDDQHSHVLSERKLLPVAIRSPRPAYETEAAALTAQEAA